MSDIGSMVSMLNFTKGRRARAQILKTIIHLRNIKLSLSLDEGNHFLVGCGIATIGDHTFGILKFIQLIPHLSRITDDIGHTGINDDCNYYFVYEKQVIWVVMTT